MSAPLNFKEPIVGMEQEWPRISEQLVKIHTSIRKGHEILGEMIGPPESGQKKRLEEPDCDLDRICENLEDAVFQTQFLVEQLERLKSRF